MTRESAAGAREQSRGEEIANSISHGVGFLLAASAAAVLLVSAARRGTVEALVGAGVFGAALAILYLSSSLYHASPPNRLKGVLRVLDHSAIYLLIAGTYTPFTLGPLRGVWGWSLLGVIWTLAAAGITMNALRRARVGVLGTVLYLAMGWLIVVAIRPLSLRVPLAGLLWLAAGGIAYTAGVGFFAARRMPYAHFVWHLFVIAGSACHFVAVLRYAG